MNKKIVSLFLILLIIIFVVGFFSIKYVKEKKAGEVRGEYTPQEEISEEQFRETIVSLYFPDKETNLIKPEARLVNVKELIQAPYNVLIELLIQGPKSDKLKVVIPENVKLLNYSKDDSKVKENLINSIVNTVTELNEVNKVKFLIDGNTNEDFKDEYVRK